MKMYIGLACILTAMTRDVMAEGFMYKFMEMSAAKPYNKIPCPKFCSENVEMGMNITSLVMQSAMNNLAFPLDFCDACEIRGLDGFSYTDRCFMSEDEMIHDHDIEIRLPASAKITCNCQLSSSPQITASKLNSAKVPLGECGYENNQNTYKCETLTCPPNGQGEAIPVNITFTSELAGSVLRLTLRSDTRRYLETGAIDVFPIQGDILTWTDDLFTVQAPADFDNSWSCLNDNKFALYCHIFANAFASFFDCWDDDFYLSLVDAVLKEYLSCKNYAKQYHA